MSRAELMPYISNKSQQVIAGAVNPKAIYSRVVSITVHIEADGTIGYNATPQVGNIVWLTHVKIRVSPKAINVAQATAFYVYAGQGRPLNEASLANWHNVLPCYDPIGSLIARTLLDGSEMLEWDMMRLFTGENRRFGVRGWRIGGVGVDAIWADFTISEG